MYATIYLTIVAVALAGLAGYVIWLWQAFVQTSHDRETKRLYRFIDDMFDRIAAGDIERYAFTQRIKRELPSGSTSDDAITANADKANTPPPFIHSR